MGLWFTEKHTKGVGFTLKVKQCLYSARSSFQQIDVIDTEEYGRVLLLDGLVMTTDRDEFIYHEMLVHPPMHAHPEAKRIVVIGGGDGGAVRELLRYSYVSQIVLCEIDKEVVEVSKRFFPSLSSGLNDERVTVVYEDGMEFLSRMEGKGFDLILVDSTDPIGAAEVLFTSEFYRICYRALDEKGIIAAQSESPFYHLDTIKGVKKGLKSARFKDVKFYVAPVPSYPGGFWSWVMALKSGHFQPDAWVKRLEEREYENLKYYNKEIHKGAFGLPVFFKRAVE